tara:strand:+ start:73 stop:387 length:315 start_codon:yes stop_codon:yes gene_type:complete
MDILDSIVALKGDAEVTVQGNDIDQIQWHDGNPTNITKEQILEKQSELETLHENLQYQRDRAKAYPPMNEFLEAYTEKEILGDSSKWDAYVSDYNKVRSDYPKT